MFKELLSVKSFENGMKSAIEMHPYENDAWNISSFFLLSPILTFYLQIYMQLNVLQVETTPFN